MCTMVLICHVGHCTKCMGVFCTLVEIATCLSIIARIPFRFRPPPAANFWFFTILVWGLAILFLYRDGLCARCAHLQHTASVTRIRQEMCFTCWDALSSHFSGTPRRPPKFTNHTWCGPGPPAVSLRPLQPQPGSLPGGVGRPSSALPFSMPPCVCNTSTKPRKASCRGGLQERPL